MITPEDSKLCYMLKLDFREMNNEFECEALILGLKIEREIGVKALQIYSYSQLLVNQVLGEYQTKVVKIDAYIAKMMEFLGEFNFYKIEHIPRERNVNKDALAKLANSGEAHALGIVPVEILSVPSIQDVN